MSGRYPGGGGVRKNAKDYIGLREKTRRLRNFGLENYCCTSELRVTYVVGAGCTEPRG